jgi:tetratricopeptide (TPR) repeat protein
MSDLADCYAALGRYAEALKLHEETLALRKAKLGPDHFHTLGSMSNVAKFYAALGRLKELGQIYKDLEQHFEKAIERDPSDHLNWFYDAPLRLHRGDIEGHRRACREMLARFSQTDKPVIADRTAKTCLLRPGAVSDLGPVRQLADRAVTGTEQHHYYPWFLLTQGMADYRSGDFPNAIARLNKSLSLVHDTRYRCSHDPTLPGTAYSFLAMALHQVGHTIEAKRALDQATQLMDQQMIARTENVHWWAHWLWFRLVYQEAEQLLNGQAEAPK